MNQVAVEHSTDVNKHLDYTALAIGNRRYTREEMAILAVAAGMEKKAMRPVILDLRAQGSFTEYFAILSAANARQASAIAEAVRMFFKKNFGVSPLSVDGLETQEWVLLDYGFLFVHVFQDPTREHYSLEQLWSKSRLVPVNEADSMALHNEAIELFKESEGESQAH